MNTRTNSIPIDESTPSYVLRAWIRTAARYHGNLSDSLEALRDARRAHALLKRHSIQELVSLDGLEPVIQELVGDAMRDFIDAAYSLTGWTLGESPQLEEAVKLASEDYKEN